MTNPARIRWGRVIGLAFALEIVLFAVFVPLQSVLSPGAWFAGVAIGCALFGYVAGRIAAIGLISRAALHGLLVGLVATTIYILICVFGPGGLPAAVAAYGAPLYVLNNVLRIAGCTVGAVHQGAGRSA